MSSPREIAPSPLNPARSGGDAAATRLWRYALPRHAPLFAVLAFSLAAAFAFSPNLLSIYGIHNDYEMLNLRSVSLFHVESGALAAIARPVAALLTNLPMLAVQSLSDYRWTRLFSLLTMCVLGAQLMSICIHRLRTRVIDALAIALAALLVLPFIYSVLNATAWAPHLVSVLLVFSAYAILSRTNVLLPAFVDPVQDRAYRLSLRQLGAYAALKPVWVACIVYQLALYDYPPNAMMLLLFPVVGVLFSRAPAHYRGLLALRDLAFVGANVVIFAVTAKLLYLPLVGLFSSGAGAGAGSNALAARLTRTYQVGFNVDPLAALERLETLAKVAGDLWFLPQARIHVALGIALVVALLVANLGNGEAKEQDGPTLSRMAFRWQWRTASDALTITIICFVMAGSTILASATGFVTYRTIAAPAAILAVVALFAARGLAYWMVRAARGSPGLAASLADGAMVLLACAAIGANFHANNLTLRLARNEFTYFTAIVKQAAAHNSATIVIVDPRPFSLPEDIPLVYDQRGRAVPPYELGCLSGLCMQSGAIVRIAARELGYPPDRFKIYSARAGDPLPGLTCELVTDKSAPDPSLPRQTRLILNWYRSLAPITCVSYSLDWHDLAIDLAR
jgi:hypothetical protein